MEEDDFQSNSITFENVLQAKFYIYFTFSV